MVACIFLELNGSSGILLLGERSIDLKDLSRAWNQMDEARYIHTCEKMMKPSVGKVGSVVLGVLIAGLVAVLIFAVTPFFQIHSSMPSLAILAPRYATVQSEHINVRSMTETLHANVTVNALPTWNTSELVTLRFSGVVAVNGETGQVEVPPGPYDIVFSPAVTFLDPGSSVIFNVSFVPWPSAPYILDTFSSVSFIWTVRCVSYPIEDPSSGVYLGAAYIYAVYGEGSSPVP